MYSGYTFFCQYVCSLGIEPTPFCTANEMLYHWATGTLIHESNHAVLARFPQEESSSGLTSMITAIAASGSPVKSQQLGEPDLTLEQKEKVLMDQYKSKPLVFLERYQAHLKPEHLEAFSHLSSDCRAQYYCKEIQRRASSTAGRKRVRNHRYAALRTLQNGTHSFFVYLNLVFFKSVYHLLNF